MSKDKKNLKDLNNAFASFYNNKELTGFKAIDKNIYDVYSISQNDYDGIKQKLNWHRDYIEVEQKDKNAWFDNEIKALSSSTGSTGSTTTSLPKSIQELLNKQKKWFPKVLQDLKDNKKNYQKKTENYAWLVWPTSSEYYTYPKDAKDIKKKQLNDLHTRYPNMLSSMNDTVIEKYLRIANEDQFRESMKRSNVNEWTKIFNKFTELLDNFDIYVIPIIDHGRISLSLDLFLKTFDKFLQQNHQSFHESIKKFETAFIKAKNEWRKAK